MFCASWLRGGPQVQRLQNQPGEEPREILYPYIEGVVCDVRDSEMIVLADDRRYFTVDLSMAERDDPGLPRTLDRGDRVRLNDCSSHGRSLVVSWVDVLKKAAKRGARRETTESGGVGLRLSMSSPVLTGEARPPIALVREVALSLVQRLPNFTCRETVKRYKSIGTRKDRFVFQDQLAAEVLYSRRFGETYRRVTLNGRRVLTPFINLSGSNSTGEFGSMLQAIFRATHDSDFHALEREPEDASAVKEYAFRVAEMVSDWKIESTYQFVIPAYVGRISVDTRSNRVIKIWRIAEGLPEAFPFRTVISEVRYGDLRIEGAGQAFLPVRASMTACQSEVDVCIRNVIEFGRYKQYTAESRLILSPAGAQGHKK